MSVTATTINMWGSSLSLADKLKAEAALNTTTTRPTGKSDKMAIVAEQSLAAAEKTAESHINATNEAVAMDVDKLFSEFSLKSSPPSKRAHGKSAAPLSPSKKRSPIALTPSINKSPRKKGSSPTTARAHSSNSAPQRRAAPRQLFAKPEAVAMTIEEAIDKLDKNPQEDVYAIFKTSETAFKILFSQDSIAFRVKAKHNQEERHCMTLEDLQEAIVENGWDKNEPIELIRMPETVTFSNTIGVRKKGVLTSKDNRRLHTLRQIANAKFQGNGKVFYARIVHHSKIAKFFREQNRIPLPAEIAEGSYGHFICDRMGVNAPDDQYGWSRNAYVRE